MLKCGDEVLELIGDLNNPYHYFVRITLFIQQTELNHGVIFPDMTFNIYDLVILKVF